MSIYIHIPFCINICSYCDFSKFYYNEKWVDNYLNELEKEVKNNYKNELVNTIYIGGGTPSCLTLKQLDRLFDIIKTFNLNKNIEFTIECNIDIVSISNNHIGVYAYDILKYHYGFDDKLCEIWAKQDI